MVEILKHEPMPKFMGAGRPRLDLPTDMEVGDCFIINSPSEVGSLVTDLKAFQPQLHQAFLRVRGQQVKSVLENGHLKVWRVA